MRNYSIDRSGLMVPEKAARLRPSEKAARTRSRGHVPVGQMTLPFPSPVVSPKPAYRPRRVVLGTAAYRVKDVPDVVVSSGATTPWGVVVSTEPEDYRLRLIEPFWGH